MIATRNFINQTWVDLSSPTKEEVDSLILSQKIDPIIAKDLYSPSPKQCLKESTDSIYTILHIPSFRHSHSQNLEQEIDFIIKGDTLITARYDSIDALHHFAKQIEVSEILSKDAGHASHIFFGLMREIYSFLFNEIDYLKDWMQDIEKNIFEGREKEMVFDISSASRSLLNFKRIVDPHETVWLNLERVSKEQFGLKFNKDVKLLIEEWQRLSLEVKNIFDMLNELRETNNSILSTKQNEIMKNLTILAFIVVPLTAVSQIFGMNTRNNPIIGSPYDFWIIVCITTSITIAMLIYFRYKKWL